MECNTTTHPQYRDRLFKAIFGRDTEQSKVWRLQLYNALNNSHYTDPDALKLNTIDNVIYITMKNDISFLIDSQMNLYEQQSTYNPNMPLRGLMYFSQLYQMYLSENEKDVHRPKLIKIPNPKFIVFYNGEKQCPDRTLLRLSDSFEIPDKTGFFEWTAEMININRGHNESLQKICEPLYNYISYVSRISDNKKKGLSGTAAVNEAVDWAIKENFLNGFFKLQKEEILAMSLTEFDEEAFRKGCYNDGFEDGVEEGITKGIEQTKIDSARKLFENGVSIELISKSLDMSEEQIKEIVKDVVIA
ncbi:MAG: hypothetical protein KBS84_02605 [Treponema sp.]|nr:hypothetical protein [Candidatus Treponema scatequi]